MINVYELQKLIKGMYAEPNSEAGQKEIHENGRTHVGEIWEDGEVTSTKNGDLYRRRRIHQNAAPLLPAGQVLFTMDDLNDDFELYNDLKLRNKHKRMIIIDGELREILDKYRDYEITWELVK